MIDSDQVVHLNGAFVALRDAKISVLDRGFIYGDGAYEVVPVYARKPFRMPQHLARLQRTLDRLPSSRFTCRSRAAWPGATTRSRRTPSRRSS